MSHRFHRVIKGSVTLVVLCVVAVLGIALASFLAVGLQGMKISNRTALSGQSRQLAEIGLEEALRAFSKNDWGNWSANPANVTSGAWTFDATNKRATRTITFDTGKLGQGITGTVKIRVDNYDANQLDCTWRNSANYRINDLVGYGGIWYRCVQNNTNQTPNGWADLTYWCPAPIPWTWRPNSSYASNEIVNYNGIWYRCTSAHTSPSSWSVSNWTSLGANAPLSSWQYSAATIYSFNDVVYYSPSLNWYRYINASPTSGSTPVVGSTWELALGGSMFEWNNGSINYNLGDVIYYTATAKWYRCILAHTSSTSIPPTTTTYWSNAPLFSTAWTPNRQYSQNDTVRYKGVWYRYINSTASTANLPTNTTYWIGANTATAIHQWNATTTYSNGDYRCYGGVWYKYINAAPNAGNTPNNTTYWTAAWANSWGITTGAPVVYAEGTIAITGSPTIKTQLRATIAPAPLFPNAVASTSTLIASVSTSAARVDSYDGSVFRMDTAASPGTAGTYSTYTYNQISSPFSAGGPNLTYSAVLAAANPATATNFNINSTLVKGYVATPSDTASPFAPLWTKSGSAILTGVSGGTGIDLTRVSRSPSIPQFDTLPSGGLATNWTSTPKGTALVLASTTNIGTPGGTTPSRYYVNGPITLTSTSPTILNINGPVILYINGDLTLNGTSAPNGIINISSTGSAEIHIAGGLKVYSGSDGIKNSTSDPKTLILIGDSSSTTTQFYSEGTNAFYGVMYMPNTTATNGLFFNSGDTNSSTVYGAVSAKKVSYQNNMNVHYDTSLRYATFGGVDQPYTVTEWRELSSDEQATMP